MVANPPHLRFYAGAPLVGSNNLHLGTLCVLDVVPREVDADACNLLANLALVVVRQLEAKAMRDFEAAQQAGEILNGICGGEVCTLPQL